MTEHTDESQMPTVSGPEPAEDEGTAGPMPQIEGYEITGKLGQGGMGTVWKAVQLSTRREVALKLLGAGAFTSDKARARFEREVELAARLEHSNIARVYDSGLHHGVYYYAMELIDGTPLDEYVRDNDLTQRQILELTRIVCQAVQHAHQRGVIHRDLKPSNILVTPDSQPHVLDFGLAKTFLEGDQGVNISIDGELAGTPAYMSPEQAAGHTDQMTTATDVYSLGVILYRLLTRKPPHDLSGTRYEVLRRIAEEEAIRPREVAKEVNKELETLLLKALAHEAELRYASAGEVAADIDNYLTGEPLVARKPTTFYFLRKRLRKYRLPITFAAAVLVAMIGVAIFAYVRIAQERDTAEQARQRANQEADHVKQEKLTADRRLYISDMLLAQQAWASNEIPRLLEILERYKGPQQAGGVDFRGFEWYYWWRACHAELLTLKGHNDWVNDVAFSPDGKRLASGSVDKTVKVWDAATGQEVLTLKGHTWDVWSVAFSPDGKRLASGGGNDTVKIWDAATGKEVFTLKGHSGGVQSVTFSPDGTRLASGSEDKTVKVWDAATGQEVRTFKGHAADVWSLAFSPDGKRLASGSEDKTVKVWDAATGQEVLSLKGHTGVVTSVAFSPDGNRLASASRDTTVKVWDAATGREVLTLKGHTNDVRSVAFSPDGKRPAGDVPGGRLASASDDKMVKVWDTATGREVLSLKGHTDSVTSVAFSPDGKRLASASGDKTVKVWAAVTGQEVLTLKGYTQSVTSVAFSPDGKRLASASDDKTVKVRDAATGRVVLTLKGHSWPVRSAAFSPDGKRLASASWDRTVKVWDAATGREVLTLKGHTNLVESVAFSPDGNRLASASWDRTVKLWDAATGREVLTLEGHTDEVHSVAFSPDGNRLASASYDRTVKVWDAVTGRELLTLRGHTDSVIGVAFSPDGKHLASASYDRTARVWDTATGRQVITLKGHSNGVWSVAFSPDGKRLASASEDETVRVWDVATGQEVLSLKGHTGVVTSVDFSPNGKRLASASQDKTVKVWDASDPAASKAEPPRKSPAAPTKPAHRVSKATSLPASGLSPRVATTQTTTDVASRADVSRTRPAKPRAELPRHTKVALSKVRTLVVLPFQDAAGQKQARGSGKMLVGAVTAELAACPGLKLIERSRVNKVIEEADLRDMLSPRAAIKIGTKVGADTVIVGMVTQYAAQQESARGSTNHRVGLSIRAVNVADGTVIYAGSGHAAKKSGFHDAATDAAKKAMKPWRQFFEDRHARKHAPPAPPGGDPAAGKGKPPRKSPAAPTKPAATKPSGVPR